MNKKIAVIIPVYGNHHLTRQLLTDIAREKEQVKVYIIDNKGDYSQYANEVIIFPKRNLGWLKGTNLGIIQAQKDDPFAYVLLNNDTRLSPGFFAGLVTTWEGTKAGLIGPVYDDVWAYQAILNQVPAVDYQPRNSFKEVPFVDGTCIFLPAQTLEQVGLLDEECFGQYGWGADLDYGLRTREKGLKVIATELSYLNHLRALSAKTGDTSYNQLAEAEMNQGLQAKWGASWESKVFLPQFDIGRVDLKHRLKILFLYNKRHFTRRHSVSRLHYMQELSKLVDLTEWGINHNGYDGKKTVSQNLGNQAYDYVFAYKPLQFKGIKELSIPLVLEYNEMIDRPTHPEVTLEELSLAPQIVFCRLKHEMRFFPAMFPNSNFVFNPHCANANVFQDRNLPKEFDVGLVGDLDPRYYPFRQRLQRLLPELQRLGYRASYRFFKRHTDDNLDAHLVELSRFINRCRVCMGCTSFIYERLEKLIEIPMSGSVLACDTPPDYEELLCPERIRIEPWMTDQEILTTIISYLEQPEELRLMQVSGVEWASNFTMERYARKVRRYLHLHQQKTKK